MNPDPARYPPKNTEEMSAIVTFLGLIDLARVKPDAKFLDKVPNTDGSLELVDKNEKPIGELKIQIKKIPAGSERFDCPVELIGYSTRVSSPFILICVDVDNKKAYWVHLHSTLPEFKCNQKTFTIKFNPLIDEIGPESPYIERWLEICDSYLTRVSKFPHYKKYADEEVGLKNVQSKDCVIFQKFIDEINTLLDVDFPVIKEEYFAGAWKLGITIHNLQEDIVHYSIYTIKYGQNAPIIRYIAKHEPIPKIITDQGVEIKGVTSMYLARFTEDEQSIQWEPRSHFNDPIKKAREFVFRYLKKAIKDNYLGVYGSEQSSELLIWFAHNFPNSVGLPVADTYELSDLDYGISVYLPMWYSKLQPLLSKFIEQNYPEAFQANPFLSFEQIASSVDGRRLVNEKEIRDAISTRLRPSPLPIYADSFRIRSLRQALDYLHANNVKQITRWDRPRTKIGHTIFECYEPDDLHFNLVRMVEGSVSDYSSFISGNQFGRFQSPLLTQEEVIIIVINNSEKHSELQVKAYQVDNKNRKLPGCSVVDLRKNPDGFKIEGKFAILPHLKLEWKHWWTPALTQFADKFPIQKGLYELLKTDIKNKFGKGFL